jgi:hypothetical protein
MEYFRKADTAAFRKTLLAHLRWLSQKEGSQFTKALQLSRLK